MSTLPRPLWLASRSPRRRRLLAEHGVEATPRPPAVDDARLRWRPEVAPGAWVMALAHLKARCVADALRAERGAGTVLGADTVCVCDGAILGQPADAAAAAAMLRRLRGRAHRTITGVCLLDVATGRRTLLVDGARVRVGALADDAVEAYVASGDWRGKAGGYNLIERFEAGWPIECDGDPSTVMGLPMRRLAPVLAAGPAP